MLFIVTWAFLETEWGQNFIVHQVTKKLSKDLQSHISIKHVNIGFFDKLNLGGVLIEDQQRDTLLAAGNLQVNITDWFFLKDKVELSYIGLENAVIKLQRTDSVWNYHYLEKYFASTPDTSKQESGIKISLKKLVLNNVSFLQKDEWAGQNIVAKIGGLDLNAHNISLTDQVLDLSTLTLDKPYFHLFNYKGKQPIDTSLHHNTDTSGGLSLGDWAAKVSSIKIKDGVFRMDNDSLTATVPYFDAAHLYFKNLNGELQNINWLKDTIHANINLSVTERSGLAVQQLKADYKLTPKVMEFGNFYLKTANSELRDYFAMHYASLSALDDYIHAVKMDANFSNTLLSSDDIAFFAPEVKTWRKNIHINGHVKGAVDALDARNLTLNAGHNTSLNGNVSIIGLPDIDQAFIALEAKDLKTTYADAVSFLPSLKSVTTPNLSRLQYLHFKGNYTGFINDFVTYGTLQTALGTLVTDLNMKFPSGKLPVYSGSIETANFQLGKFLNSVQLGAVSFKGDVKGKGFAWKEVNANINGTIRSINFNGYTYQNITADGNIKDQQFNGKFGIKDQNADLELTGLVNLSKAATDFKVKADIATLNLKALKLIDKNLVVKGGFDLNFTGNTLSDFLGTARITNATLFNNGQAINIDSLVLSSSYKNGLRTLAVQSNEFDATITGKFDLEALPDAVTHFLARYYPAYIRHPHHAIKPQSFGFNINTGNVDAYIKLVDESLSGFNNSHISGSLDMATNSMNIAATVPQASYDKYEFSDIRLKGEGNYDSLVLKGGISNTVISDSLSFPGTDFSIKASNDVSQIAFNTSANQTLNKANLSAQVKTFSDGASILFNPSSFVLNGKTWTIAQGGELNFRSKTALQGQLLLKESNQEIRIFTHPSDIGNWNNLNVTLQNINLGDFSPFLVKDMRIEGLLNGNVIVEDPQNRFNVSSHLRTDQLRLDNDSIGSVDASLLYNNSTGAFTATGNNMDAEHRIAFDMDLNFKDTTNTHQDRITIKPVKYPVKILERFLGDLFSDMQGYVTGQLDIVGNGAQMDYIGKAKLTDAGLKVNFTQVFYKIDDTEIELTKDAILLGTLKLRDRFGNTATVSGSIKHKSFSNMVFDIEAQTDTKPMELINTSYQDNQTFYGRAMGNGTFTLRGPENNIYMYINAHPSERDSSYITLPPARSRESGQADFMVERKYGREMTAKDYEGSGSNITYEVDLTANPLVNIQVILDELTGDAIKARGSGNLHIRSGSAEPLTIRGRYEIQDGSYMFTFQSFFKKPFVLKPGGNNYIEWTGDPYAANIHFDAVYTAEQVSFAPLASGFAADQIASGSGSSGVRQTDLSRYRDDVNVIATLTGELFHPTFTFKLEFPNNNQISNNPAFAFGISQLEKNTNEINKQVTYLIVFNSFAPLENTTASPLQPFNELAYNTISGLFFGEVNKRLNQALSKILRSNNLTVNFTGSLYNRNLLNQGSGNFNINQSNVNVTVGVPLINDRFVVTFGSTLDVPLQDIQQNIQFLPDVTAEWLINKSGSIRASFFYRQNLDFLSGSTTGSAIRTKRSGASISYRKEFESITNLLFGNHKYQPELKKATPKDTTVASQ